jgi:hypothetical protein
MKEFRLPDAVDEADDIRGWSMSTLATVVSCPAEETESSEEGAYSTGTVVRHNLSNKTKPKLDTVEGLAGSPTDDEDQAAYEWASELSHIMLGTESLFTFFEIVDGNNNYTAGKKAVVAAFLELIDMERKKRGGAPLPLSVTAASLVNSPILTHTIFIGVTTLAAFLAQLDFGAIDEVTITDLYETWGVLSKKEARAGVLATTSMMGALGRALGRIE